MKKYSLALALVVMIALIPAAAAQDLHKSYSVGSGGFIRIKNISGDIKITGYNGNTITVDAVAVGRDRQYLTIEDLSTSNGVELQVKYPERDNTSASVNFEVRVPSAIDYDFDKINSVSGDLEIADVRGRLHLNSVSGDITATHITGTINANSVSGDVEADIVRAEGTADMKFNSVSGDVSVTLPGNIGANLNLSTLSGSLTTNFPIQVQEKEFGPGRSASGTVGSRADFGLKMSTISGDISLTAK
jgi:DUF4097 and DUF4098 domain-containing protein YvlB